MTTTKNSFNAQDSERDGVVGHKFSKAKLIAEQWAFVRGQFSAGPMAQHHTPQNKRARGTVLRAEVIAFIEPARVD